MLRKGVELLHVFFVGTNTRERMNVFKIFGMIKWQLMHDIFKDFELRMKCVFSWKKYVLFCESFKGFWDWKDAKK
jgi:hypothetical protein